MGAFPAQFAPGPRGEGGPRPASQRATQSRHAHGVKQPATLHEDELEYQEGWKERRARLELQFETKPPLTFTDNGAHGHGNGHGAAAPKAAAAAGKGRPEEID